jgi:predicted nucleic acid-binding protein
LIAADTSTWIAFLQGDGGEDSRLLNSALADCHVLMVPAVLTELLSDPALPAAVREVLTAIPLVEPESGYWERAGLLRSTVLARGRKARLGDALIAQTCIDRHLPLLTRDRDFRSFAETAELDLILTPGIQ